MYVKSVLENTQRNYLDKTSLTVFLAANNFKQLDQAVDVLVKIILEAAILRIEKETPPFKRKTPKEAVEAHTFELFEKVRKAIQAHPFFVEKR